MAAHTLILGSLDLAENLKAQDEDALDPFNPEFSQPQFSNSPAVEGGVKVLDKIGLKETVWPLSTDSAPRTFEQSIGAELRKAGLRLEWKEPGATDSTFFDVAHGRLEPAEHYHRRRQDWGDYVLRLWLQPYGHTGTERIVATYGGTAAARLSIASLAGDAPALLSADIRGGSQAPWLGEQIAVLAAGIHPSQMVDFPAASFIATPGNPLVGATGAQGSQYRQAARFEVPLPIPSAYVGRQRVLALARSSADPGVGVVARDDAGNALGPTAIASSFRDFALIDLGLLTVPSVVGPTYTLRIAAGYASTSDVVPVSAGGQSPHFNRVFVLPEERLALWAIRPGEPIAQAADEFAGASAALVGQKDALGNTWASFPNASYGTVQPLARAPEHGGIAYVPTAGAAGFYGALSGAATQSAGRARLRIGVPTQGALGSACHASAGVYLWANNWDAGFGQGTAPFLRLGRNGQSLGGVSLAATSLGVPSGALGLLELALDWRPSPDSDNVIVSAQLRRLDGQPLVNTSGSQIDVASVGASPDTVSPGPVGFGIAHASVTNFNKRPEVRHFAADGFVSQGSPVLAREALRAGPVPYRESAATTPLELAARYQQGAVPQLPAPSPGDVFALVHGYHGGPGSDVLEVVARARERWEYIR